MCDHVWTEDMAALRERGRKQAAGEFFNTLKKDFPEYIFVWNLDDLLCEERGGKTVGSTHDTSGRFYADWAGHLSLYSSVKFSPPFIQFFEANSLIGGVDKGKGGGDNGMDGAGKGTGGGEKGKGKGKGGEATAQGGNKAKGGAKAGKGSG